LKNGADSATPVQPVVAHGPGFVARMLQCNVGAQFERIDINVAGSFPRSDQGSQYRLTAMDYFTKWPEVFANPNQDSSIVAEALVTNFFCRFGISRELHSDQGRNFESRLLQEVL
jgi:hypothetical protein